MQIIIDLHPGKPGEEQNLQTLLEELSKAGYTIQEGRGPIAKLIVADTDTKRFNSLNSYFPVVYGFMNKQKRPLSVEKALAQFDGLFREPHADLLTSLYKQAFVEFRQGK